MNAVCTIKITASKKVVLTPLQQNRRPASPMTTFCVFPTTRTSTTSSASFGSGRSCTSSGLASVCGFARKRWTRKTSTSPTLLLTSRPPYSPSPGTWPTAELHFTAQQTYGPDQTQCGPGRMFYELRPPPCPPASPTGSSIDGKRTRLEHSPDAPSFSL